MSQHETTNFYMDSDGYLQDAYTKSTMFKTVRFKYLCNKYAIDFENRVYSICVDGDHKICEIINTNFVVLSYHDDYILSTDGQIYKMTDRNEYRTNKYLRLVKEHNITKIPKGMMKKWNICDILQNILCFCVTVCARYYRVTELLILLTKFGDLIQYPDIKIKSGVKSMWQYGPNIILFGCNDGTCGVLLAHGEKINMKTSAQQFIIVDCVNSSILLDDGTVCKISEINKHKIILETNKSLQNIVMVKPMMIKYGVINFFVNDNQELFSINGEKINFQLSENLFPATKSATML